ncbi:MAG: helix-turn-helix domain-containing protein [Steroidobacteraceae bacterium]
MSRRVNPVHRVYFVPTCARAGGEVRPLKCCDSLLALYVRRCSRGTLPMGTAGLTRASCGYENRILLDSLASTACAMRLGAREETDILQARFNFVRLGAVNLLHYRAMGFHMAERTRAHILQDDARYFLLCIPLHARYTVSYRGHVEEAPSRSFVFLPTDTPFETIQRGLTRHSAFEAAVLRLPAAPLRLRIPTIDDLCGHIIRMTPAMASAIRSTLDWALSVGSVDEITGEAVGAGLLEMFCAYAERTTDVSAKLKHGRSSLERTLERAKTFIESHLADAHLSAAEVAKYCRVSIRYLHTVFASQSDSAWHYIRERRLQQCRQALRDEAQSHRPVVEIAASWGFTDPCHFSKAYKSRFGVAPSVDRRHDIRTSMLSS